MPYLSLQHLDKQFGETSVLQDIHLDVEQGEFIVLVGSSGCGKSTLLRCIAGLETPTHGDVQLEGQSIVNKAPQDRDLAMVFQNYALYPHMNVYDNIAFGLKMRKTPKVEIQEKVSHVANMLGLEALLKRKPAQLSGGQCQRVALGRAIVRNPKLFLMDEPLSNLDAQLRQHMRHELKALHQQLEATTLYVTHDHTETLTLADKIVVLNKGKVAQFASPIETYQFPANVFVARFMTQMNFLRLKRHEAGYQLLTQDDRTISDAVPCSEERRSFLESVFRRVNQSEILVGIRPEHIRLSESEVNMTLLLQHRELHGAFQTLRFSTAHHLPYQVVSYHPFSGEVSGVLGEALSCGFNWNEAQFFDAQTELAIPINSN